MVAVARVATAAYCAVAAELGTAIDAAAQVGVALAAVGALGRVFVFKPAEFAVAHSSPQASRYA